MAWICYLSEGKLTSSNQLYDVSFKRETLVRNHKDPEYACCRKLADLGLTGEVIFYWKGKYKPTLVIKDLVKEAGYCIDENKRYGPRRKKYVKMPILV